MPIGGAMVQSAGRAPAGVAGTGVLAMRQKVYIETTIVSYLTAKPAKDVITLAHQKVTREWWRRHRQQYELYSSQSVLDEASDGDPTAARKRLDALAELPLVPASQEAAALAKNLVAHGLLPKRAAADATHLAMATVGGMDVLLTWNCRHLANASMLVQVSRFIRTIGYEAPIVCTPDELMGDPGKLRE